MLGITFLVGMIVGCYKLNEAVTKHKKVVLDKGIPESKLKSLTIAMWCFIIPPICALLLSDTYTIAGAVIYAAIYLPGTIIAYQLSEKFGTGYDYERKAGKEFNKITWLGYAGMGLVVFNWLFINASSLMKTTAE
jgi:hypothetical protein